MSSYAQATQTIYYTTLNDLPSNTTYKSVVDKRGFLWVATENGLARFDGKKFETFTTAHGLTDNEIIDVLIDSNQVIWAVPFLHIPCYFNEKTSRFENEETDPALRQLEPGNTSTANVLRYGGLFFSNNRKGAYMVKNGRTTTFATDFPIRKVIEYQPGKLIFWAGGDKVMQQSGNGFEMIQKLEDDHFNINIKGDTTVSTIGNEVVIMRITANGRLEQVLRKKFGFTIRILSDAGIHYALISSSGNKYLLNRQTLEIESEIQNDKTVRNIIEDKDGNIWLSSINNGLIKIQQQRVLSYFPKELVGSNFSAIVKQGNLLVAGNNTGELVSYDGVYGVKKTAITGSRKVDAWVRRLIPIPGGIFMSCQAGSYIVDKTGSRTLQEFTGLNNRASKMVARINDTLLCMGNHVTAYKYNLRSQQFIDSVVLRVTALAADKQGAIYMGSTTGFYKWMGGTNLRYFGVNYKALSFRTNTIAVGPDGLVWVGLGTDTLVVLQNDIPISALPLGRQIPGTTCKSLYCNQPGELWLGTDKGLNKINYKLNGTTLTYTNSYYGMADGLLGEQVNDITLQNDTLYLATTNGINYLTTRLQLPPANIATFITGVLINGVKRPLEDNYRLDYDENSITVNFSGVDLTGFIPLFEYNINNAGWRPTERIELSQLQPASYSIAIRAIRRDGTPSTQQANIKFTIKTPFWKSGLFWLVLSLIGFSTILYIVQRRNRQKQQTAVAKAETEKRLAQLEMQALMAQINPHFVFNCLNSIKGFIYDRDYRQADVYLDKFSSLLRSTMDNAEASIISLQDEVNYLDTYLQLERLRFADKFTYTITLQPNVDPQQYFVPAMLLQPYVENAIRHGVRHLQNIQGHITIAIALQGAYLTFSIDDDGVGRKKAQQLKSENHIEYQSRGMQLSKRRAELYNIAQEIIDKQDAANQPAGTTILLRIPVTLKP